MRTKNDVEAYLARMNRTFQSVDGEPGTYLVHSSAAMPPIALRVDPPLVVLRVRIADAGAARVALLRRLLELNAQSLIHTAYGLEQDHVVLGAAFALESLDLNELEAALDEIDLVLAEQVPLLVKLAKSESIPAPGGT